MLAALLSTLLAVQAAASGPLAPSSRAEGDPPAQAADRVQDAQGIAERKVGALTAAIRARDGQAWAAEFCPDAEFMNVFGQVVTGREQIAALTDRVFNGPLRARVVQMDIRKVRQLAPTVIVVDTRDSDASGSSEVVTHMKLVLQEMNGDWCVAAGQNTRVVTPTFDTGIPEQQG